METQSNTVELGNTKTNSKSRGWCFTLNNYNEEEYNTIINYGHSNTVKFIVGKETGEQNTPHLQGYFYFKNAIKFETIKKINNRLHIEKAKGKPEQNFTYCKKQNNYIQKGFKINRHEILLEKYKNIEWKPWQKEILEIIKTEPDDRKINWIYDYEGGKGKSFLTKYIFLTHNTLIADGKKNDVFNQIKTELDNEREFKIVILDIPRHNMDFINYGLIEQIKNGLIYSGKYEGGCYAFDNVHILIFSNELPDESKFTNDRWNIIKL